jgi:crotonobetainyl-CoA:carnitine CoA-transferase CaiB-like acyl-CoA transferase
VLDQPALAVDPRFSSNASRVEHHDELENIIVGAFAGKTAQQVVESLERAQIANARMNTVDEFLEHPQLAARGKWREVDSPAGPLRALLPPFGFDDVEPRMGRIPALGEHTDGILTELGFDPDTIAAWRKAGIV